MKKTQFQKECEHALINLVRASGQRLSENSLSTDVGEKYIEGRVSGIQFWIYEDGTQISFKDKDYRLEKEDYDSLQQLQAEFLAIFTKLLKKKNTKQRKHIEQFNCKQCKKKWEVNWVADNSDDGIVHEVVCACGKVLKTVKTSPEGPPVMIPQQSKDNTLAACLPAAIAGALYPILSIPILLAVYALSWLACGVTFADDDNPSTSALVGIAIKSLLFVSFAAAIGALLGNAFWWWWQ